MGRAIHQTLMTQMLPLMTLTVTPRTVIHLVQMMIAAMIAAVVMKMMIRTKSR